MEADSFVTDDPNDYVDEIMRIIDASFEAETLEDRESLLDLVEERITDLVQPFLTQDND